MKQWMCLLFFAFGVPLIFGRTVSLEQVVCNSGATLSVPVVLDDATGISSVYVQINYDPLILVLTEVERGDLERLFSRDFIVTEEPGNVALLTFATHNATGGSGTLAMLHFTVREGADALYSDLTLADVQLKEETFTKDLSFEEPIQPHSAMVRAFSPTADCHDRRCEGALRVAANTTLANLTLTTGDALTVSDKQTPIVITETLAVDGALRLRAPKNGWHGQRYEVLSCTNPNVVFAQDDIPETYTLSAETIEGMTTYILTSTATETVIPVTAEVDLSTADQDAIRNLLASLLTDVTSIRVKGSLEAIQVGVDLGILPKFKRVTASEERSSASILEATFGLPNLKITAFDVKAGRVAVQVVPAEGATLAQPLRTGVLHLQGTPTLSQQMSEIELPETAIDCSDYLSENHTGTVRFTLQLGDYSFFKVVVNRSQTSINP